MDKLNGSVSLNIATPWQRELKPKDKPLPGEVSQDFGPMIVGDTAELSSGTHVASTLGSGGGEVYVSPTVPVANPEAIAAAPQRGEVPGRASESWGGGSPRTTEAFRNAPSILLGGESPSSTTPMNFSGGTAQAPSYTDLDGYFIKS